MMCDFTVTCGGRPWGCSTPHNGAKLPIIPIYSISAIVPKTHAGADSNETAQAYALGNENSWKKDSKCHLLPCVSALSQVLPW